MGLEGGDVMEGWALWWEVVMEEKEGCEAWLRTGREELLRNGGGAPAMVAKTSKARVVWAIVSIKVNEQGHM